MTSNEVNSRPEILEGTNISYNDTGSKDIFGDDVIESITIGRDRSLKGPKLYLVLKQEQLRKSGISIILNPKAKVLKIPIEKDKKYVPLLTKTNLERAGLKIGGSRGDYFIITKGIDIPVLSEEGIDLVEKAVLKQKKGIHRDVVFEDLYILNKGGRVISREDLKKENLVPFFNNKGRIYDPIDDTFKDPSTKPGQKLIDDFGWGLKQTIISSSKFGTDNIAKAYTINSDTNPKNISDEIEKLKNANKLIEELNIPGTSELQREIYRKSFSLNNEKLTELRKQQRVLEKINNKKFKAGDKLSPEDQEIIKRSKYSYITGLVGEEDYALPRVPASLEAFYNIIIKVVKDKKDDIVNVTLQFYDPIDTELVGDGLGDNQVIVNKGFVIPRNKLKYRTLKMKSPIVTKVNGIFKSQGTQIMSLDTFIENTKTRIDHNFGSAHGPGSYVDIERSILDMSFFKLRSMLLSTAKLSGANCSHSSDDKVLKFNDGNLIIYSPRVKKPIKKDCFFVCLRSINSFLAKTDSKLDGKKKYPYFKNLFCVANGLEKDATKELDVSIDEIKRFETLSKIGINVFSIEKDGANKKLDYLYKCKIDEPIFTANMVLYEDHYYVLEKYEPIQNVEVKLEEKMLEHDSKTDLEFIVSDVSKFKVLYYDIETNEVNVNGNMVLKPVTCAWYWGSNELRDNTYDYTLHEKDVKVSYGFDCMEAMIDDLLENMYTKPHNTTYIHKIVVCGYNNSNFDDRFLISKILDRDDYRLKIHSTIKANNSLLSTKIGYRGMVTCFDLCRFLMSPLKDACKDFKSIPSKMEGPSFLDMQIKFDTLGVDGYIDYLKTNDEGIKFIKYNKYDVLALASCTNIFRNNMRKLVDVEVFDYITLAQLSYDLYDKLFKQIATKYCVCSVKKLNCDVCDITIRYDDYRIYTLIQNSLVGGRTQAFVKGSWLVASRADHDDIHVEKYEEVEVGGFKMMDVVSLYPYVMINRKFPLGRCKSTSYYRKDKLGIYLVKCVEVDGIRNIRPLRVEGEALNWEYKGEFYQYLTTPEIELYLKRESSNGKKIQIYGGYYWEESSDFEEKNIFAGMKNFVKEKNIQDKLKVENDSNYNPVLRNIYKLLMNSLSGKFLQRYFMEKWSIINNSKEYLNFIKNVKNDSLDFETLNKDTLIVTGKIHDDDIDLKKVKPNIIGVYIYAYARCYMYEYLERYNALYTDTDSMILRTKDYDRFIKEEPSRVSEEHNKVLGNFVEEIGNNSTHLTIIEAKHYALLTTDYKTDKGLSELELLKNNDKMSKQKIKFKGANRMRDLIINKDHELIYVEDSKIRYRSNDKALTFDELRLLYNDQKSFWNNPKHHLRNYIYVCCSLKEFDILTFQMKRVDGLSDHFAIQPVYMVKSIIDRTKDVGQNCQNIQPHKEMIKIRDIEMDIRTENFYKLLKPKMYALKNKNKKISDHIKEMIVIIKNTLNKVNELYPANFEESIRLDINDNSIFNMVPMLYSAIYDGELRNVFSIEESMSSDDILLQVMESNLSIFQDEIFSKINYREYNNMYVKITHNFFKNLKTIFDLGFRGEDMMHEFFKMNDYESDLSPDDLKLYYQCVFTSMKRRFLMVGDLN